jgi:hypothetical protein
MVSPSSSNSLKVGGLPALLCRRHSSAIKSPESGVSDVRL